MRLLACLSVAALALPGPAAPAAAKELAPGYEIVGKLGFGKINRLYVWNLRRTNDKASARIELVVVTLPEAQTRARIQPVLKRGAAPSLFTPALCPGSTVVVNGSFYIRDGDKSAPLGLVRVGGKTLAKPSLRKSGGFLAINKGKVEVLPRAEIARALNATDAIESTPIVVKDGANDMRSDDGAWFDRVAVGTASGDRTVVVGAFAEDQDSVSLYQFSALARAAVAATGGRLDDLLAMDGGPSAHIYLPGLKKLYGYRGAAYLPNAICIGPK